HTHTHTHTHKHCQLACLLTSHEPARPSKQWHSLRALPHTHPHTHTHSLGPTRSRTYYSVNTVHHQIYRQKLWRAQTHTLTHAKIPPPPTLHTHQPSCHNEH